MCCPSKACCTCASIHFHSQPAHHQRTRRGTCQHSFPPQDVLHPRHSFPNGRAAIHFPGGAPCRAHHPPPSVRVVSMRRGVQVTCMSPHADARTEPHVVRVKISATMCMRTTVSVRSARTMPPLQRRRRTRHCECTRAHPRLGLLEVTKMRAFDMTVNFQANRWSGYLGLLLRCP